MLKSLIRLFTDRPAQEVVTALCQESQAQRREIAELRRLLGDRSAPVPLVPINPASRCPAVSGSTSGPAGCPRVDYGPNYAPDGLYIGDPKNWVPPHCPLCQ